MTTMLFRAALAAVAMLGAASAMADQLAPGAASATAPAPCPGNPAALGTARTLTFDPATLPPVGLQTYPQTLALADHEVVLTFDDGPSPKTTPRVLDALERECVRATFFLIGRNAQTADALVRREIMDGDLVGHHSWSHPAITERGLPDSKAQADILHGMAADDKAAYGGVKGTIPRVPLFRFPGFGDSPALLAWLKGRHIAVFSADLWASDWLPQTPEAELALLMGRLDKAGRGIILLHDIKAQTADMVPALLAALKAGHYRVVALQLGPDEGAPPIRPAPAGWSSTTEKTLRSLWPRFVKDGARPWPETLHAALPDTPDTPRAVPAP